MIRYYLSLSPIIHHSSFITYHSSSIANQSTNNEHKDTRAPASKPPGYAMGADHTSTIDG